MKYLIRSIYAFAIGLNVGLLGMAIFTDWGISFLNQVIGQLALIGWFIFFLVQFEKYEKRRAEISKMLDEALEELKEHLNGIRKSMDRAKEAPAPAKKRVQRKRVAKKKVIVATGNNGTIK